MTLNGWQERLTTYFTGLRSSLDAAGNARPIFALEHDLTPAELEDLISGLREHTNSSSPATRHHYAWSVYAAEIGYKFKGDEYWQTFAENLPGWKINEDRDSIKDAFYSFQRQFRGALPSGNWAKNFTIICWPITHALLPKDLQRHLANILYDVRGAFTPALLEDTGALGRLIALHSGGKSSRFRKFVEEYDLVGRISVALLSPDSAAAEGLLAPHTLKRITKDLQAEQNAHAWLSAARQKASSVKLTGLKTRSLMPGVSLSAPLKAELLASERAHQERLELTIKQVGEESWAVVALLPNLSHLEPSNAEFQKVFTTQRGVIDVSARSHFAPRYFAINRQDVALKNWPIPNQSILSFEQTTSGLRDLLNETCSIPKISGALFRLRDDGTGINVKSKVIRPGELYVFLSTDAQATSMYLRESRRIAIDCNGVNGILLDVPDRISDSYHNAVRSLGLSVSLALQVTPVGYPAKSWDEDGEVGWTVSSPKLLAITSTVEVRGLALNLLGEDSHDVIQTAMDGHGPIFIDLEGLRAGQYQMHVTAQAAAAGGGVIAGSIFILVSPDDDAILSSENAQGFTVLATPTLPTFEELWADSAKVNIFGPNGAQLKAQLAFYSDPIGLTTPTFSHFLGKVSLPVTEADWENTFKRVKKDKKVMAAHEDAVSCRLIWRSIELGESTLHCEREFVPLRWSVHTRSNHHKVRLVQNDSTSELQLLAATFKDPAVLVPFSLSSKLEFEQSGDGGLFVARSGAASAAVVLTSPAVSGFGSLRPNETRIPRATDASSLEALCEVFGLWKEAGLTDDPILRMKLTAAVRVIKTAILESICGGSWISAEAGLEMGRLRVSNLCGMIGRPNDYKFQRSLSDALPFAPTFTDEEFESVLVALAQSMHSEGGMETQRSPQHAVLQSFIRLLRPDSVVGNISTTVHRDCCTFALGAPQLMRLMRLFMLARETAFAEPSMVSGALS
jgi:hypothetical protein